MSKFFNSSLIIWNERALLKYGDNLSRVIVSPFTVISSTLPCINLLKSFTELGSDIILCFLKKSPAMLKDSISFYLGYSEIDQIKNKSAKIPMKLLDELLVTMKKGCLCALCGAIPVPISNILKYFGDEMKNDIIKDN